MLVEGAERDAIRIAPCVIWTLTYIKIFAHAPGAGHASSFSPNSWGRIA